MTGCMDLNKIHNKSNRSLYKKKEPVYRNFQQNRQNLSSVFSSEQLVKTNK